MNDWLSHRARSTPEATALISAETDEEWDYAAFDDAVDDLSGRLSAFGVEAGDHVGMLLPTRPSAARLVFAVMRLGATLVPLNTRLTPRELAEQVETADVTTLVCGDETEALAVDAVAATKPAADAGDVADDPPARTAETVASVPIVSIDDRRPADPPPNDADSYPNDGDSPPNAASRTTRVASLTDVDPVSVTPADWNDDDTLLLLFTSGTTGDPKAVVLTHGNVLTSAVASAFHLGVLPSDRWLVPLSLFHMGGLAPLYRSTLYGTAVVLRKQFDPGSTADDIGRFDVTGISLVPTMLKQMLDSRGTLSDSLRFALVGGAPTPERLIERCRDYYVPVCPTYGMTETASQIATARPEEAFENVGTVGRPLYGTTVTVVDEEGNPVDPETTGELVVSGPTVSPGYYANPEATDAAFSDRGLHTGDVGYRDETGRLYVLNRKDDRIVTGGENVEPGEIVDVLRTHSGVADAAIVGIPDREWGERVAALVVARDPDLTAADVENYCRERLAGYKLPRVVRFVDELPRTASGTVERSSVREVLTAPSTGDAGDAENHEGPDAGSGDEDDAADTTTDDDNAVDTTTDYSDTAGEDDATADGDTEAGAQAETDSEPDVS